MRSKKVLNLFLILIASLAVVLAGRGVFAAETHVIRIHDVGELSPEALTIRKGDTVVWSNMSGTDASVVFSGGSEVKRACVAPTGFVLQGGEYMARNIPNGGVASLCFIEAGRFQFRLEGGVGRGTESLRPGSVTVR